jgi:tetratricopeptide (TPR) repeat protein
MRERIADRTHVAIVCVALIALVWFVFNQAIHFPLVNYDDAAYISESPIVIRGLSVDGIAWAFTHTQAGNWHPFTVISHMVDCSLFGLHAGGHHFTNVLFHTLTVLALFSAFRALTGSLWRSAFVAAIFAVHPLRAESVAWIAERKDVLSGFFFALTLGTYVWYARRPSLGRYLVVSILFACGLMSKPMLVTLPLVLLLLDYWPLGRWQSAKRQEQQGLTERERKSASTSQLLNTSTSPGLVVEKIPLFLLAVASSIATLIAQRPALGSFEQLPLSLRMNNAVLAYLTYIGQMFWPAKLAVFYPMSDNAPPLGRAIVAVALLVAITALTFFLSEKRPYLIVGWLWYVLMLVPVVGIVQVGLQSHADRYTYLPQIGLYIAITWTIADLLKTPNAEWSASDARHRRQSDERRSERARAASEFQPRTPNVERKTLNSTLSVRCWALGVCFVGIVIGLAVTGRAQVSYWRDSEVLWNHTIAVTKDNYFAHASLADLLMRRGRVPEAIEHSKEALRIRPNDANAQNNLGLALLQSGNTKDAATHLEKALQIDPGLMNAEVNLAWVLATSPDDSLRNGARAVQLAEDVASRAGYPNAIVLRTLAAGYAEVGRFNEAIQTAQQAIEIARATGNEGLIGDLEKSIEAYRSSQPLRSGP